MTYSIIGSGNVGVALARQFVRSDIEVCIANKRSPDSLTALANELGKKVTPTTLQDALKAEIVIFAVPFRAYTEIASAIADWSGKIVIDAMNARDLTLEELDGRESSDILALALPGAKVVKTFNQLPAALLGSDPFQPSGRRVMFVASNDERANAEVVRLVDQLGFAAIALGRIAEGGALLRFRGALMLQNLIKP